MVLKTDDCNGKFLKICNKLKKIPEKIRNISTVWKHIFVKYYFENKKFSEKFRNVD